MKTQRWAWILAVLCCMGLSGSPFAQAGRLQTVGFEFGVDPNGHPQYPLDLDGLTLGAANVNTVKVRSGVTSLEVQHTTSSTVITDLGFSRAGVSECYARVYFNLATLNTARHAIFALYSGTPSSAQGVCAVFVETNNTLTLHNYTIGATSPAGASAAIVANTWYRLEIHCIVSATVGVLDARLDGVSFASASSLNTGTANVAVALLGISDGSGTDVFNTYYDDFAANDTSGVNQNSWPGSGKIVLLSPISDNARGGWTGGAGGTTSLFDAVNNHPPLGNATETNLTQIKNLVSSTTDNYDANLQSYTTGGLVASDTITLVQAVCEHGEKVATGTKAGALKIVSNPAQSVEDTFTFGDDQGADSTWGSSTSLWRSAWGVPQYSPAVTLGTSPVLRVGKRTATTAEANVDAMGIYVEYTNAAVVSVVGRRPLLGVGF